LFVLGSFSRPIFFTEILMKIARFSRFASALSSALILVAFLATSAANSALTTLNLTADCTDCAAAAGTANYIVTAQLVLEDYTAGAPLEDRNASDNYPLFYFRYNGSNLLQSFSATRDTIQFGVNTLFGDDGDLATITDYSAYASFMRGSINDFNRPANFELYIYERAISLSFAANGNWAICTIYTPVCTSNVSADYGSTYTITQVNAPDPALPAPGVASLVLLGLGFAASRKRQATTRLFLMQGTSCTC
jgi:hypothetical protein